MSKTVKQKPTLPEHGPRGEGVDPLTAGKQTFGENIRESSDKLRDERNTGGPVKSDSQQRLESQDPVDERFDEDGKPEQPEDSDDAASDSSQPKTDPKSE